MGAKSLHRSKKQAGSRQSYPMALKTMGHLWIGDCGVRGSQGDFLAVPLCLTLLFYISFAIYCCPMKMGYRVCIEADQSFLSINSTFLRDHFSFSKAPNIKEQINKRPLESIFQVLTHAFWLPTNFKILFCIVLVKRDNLYRGSLTK